MSVDVSWDLMRPVCSAMCSQSTTLNTDTDSDGKVFLHAQRPSTTKRKIAWETQALTVSSYPKFRLERQITSQTTRQQKK